MSIILKKKRITHKEVINKILLTANGVCRRHTQVR